MTQSSVIHWASGITEFIEQKQKYFCNDNVIVYSLINVASLEPNKVSRLEGGVYIDINWIKKT